MTTLVPWQADIKREDVKQASELVMSGTVVLTYPHDVKTTAIVLEGFAGPIKKSLEGVDIDVMQIEKNSGDWKVTLDYTVTDEFEQIGYPADEF